MVAHRRSVHEHSRFVNRSRGNCIYLGFYVKLPILSYITFSNHCGGRPIGRTTRSCGFWVSTLSCKLVCN